MIALLLREWGKTLAAVILFAWFTSAIVCLAVLAIWFLWMSVAQAEEPLSQFDNYLVLVIDVSGSIDKDEYALQKSGYVEILTDPTVGQALDRTGVAIVEFGSSATVTVGFTDVGNAGALYSASERPFMGSTNVVQALDLALKLLAEKSGKLVIDISGDGADNVHGYDGTAMVHALRDLATLNHIEINSLAITLSEDSTSNSGYGEGGSIESLTRWYAEAVNGFSMSIASLEDLAYALRRKLFAEVASNYAIAQLNDHE